MTLGRPSGDVAGDAGDGIERAFGRGEVDVLPVGVVEAGFGPQRLVRCGVERRVADTELVGPVEREDRLAERDVVGPVGNRAGGFDSAGLGAGDCAMAVRQRKDSKKAERCFSAGRASWCKGLDPHPYYNDRGDRQQFDREKR